MSLGSFYWRLVDKQRRRLESKISVTIGVKMQKKQQLLDVFFFKVLL